MTKYILHGGNTSEPNIDNNSFFKEMTVGFRGKTTILLNYFSRKDDEVTQKFEQDKRRFLRLSKNKYLVFEIAQAETLARQLKKANVMYMRGGTTAWLTEKMSRTSNLKALFKGKVIAGSSAGAYALSKYYWGNDAKKIDKGLGVLNIKTYCHYSPKDKLIVSRLLKYKEDLPLLILPNHKWTVFFN